MKCKTCGKFCKDNDGHICPISIPVICKNKECQREFMALPSAISRGWGKYCSIPCRMTILNKGVKLSPESIEKMRASLIKRYPYLLCNMEFKNEWGVIEKCKNLRKRYNHSCGKHKHDKQRYFCSIHNPYYCIDMKL